MRCDADVSESDKGAGRILSLSQLFFAKPCYVLNPVSQECDKLNKRTLPNAGIRLKAPKVNLSPLCIRSRKNLARGMKALRARYFMRIIPRSRSIPSTYVGIVGSVGGGHMGHIKSERTCRSEREKMEFASTSRLA